jgi:tRNA G46 methylase TrmB
MIDDARRYAPSAARNRDAILAILSKYMPKLGTVLEVASGSGEHIVHFAAALPRLTFQPSDPDPAARASIDAWTLHLGLSNVAPALALDIAQVADTSVRADVVMCIDVSPTFPPITGRVLG